MNATQLVSLQQRDEPFTTPSEEWIRLAAHGQRSCSKNRNLKHTMNMLSGFARNEKRSSARSSRDSRRIPRDPDDRGVLGR